MPSKKVTKPKAVQTEAPKSSTPKQSKLTLKNVGLSLSVVFFTIWIVIGIFIMVVIVQSFRQGAFAGLFGKSQSPAPGSPQTSQTIIPGVGMVDVDCVKTALSSESIQKIFDEGNTSSLSEEEKQSLDPCILQAEEAPSPSPVG